MPQRPPASALLPALPPTAALAPHRLHALPRPRPRPTVRGPFLFEGERKLVLRGVTYGTFAADEAGDLHPSRERIRADFEAMAAAHVNCVRVYTPPPDRLLEEAERAGLRVLVGIHWGGESCDFDDPELLRRAERAVRETVERCRRFAHVVVGYLIGNEIPPLVVRFHGRRTIERFLRRLRDVAKATDPECLVSYGNYPSTEFLQLDFLDFYTLNVYLLEREKLSAYLDRVLMQTKGKPLLVGEIGDDSVRKGPEHQARLLDWTIPTVLNKGACGVCVFAWTDEWVVGGHRITDWAFGLVDAARRPKPALETVARRYGQTNAELTSRPWPRISVVVCNYNGGETLEETLRSLLELDYPDYEVVYVDDGSTDDSLSIARRFADRIRIVAQENRGLSVARNVGAQAATGEIVAYTDSDAFADPDWLRHLAVTFAEGPWAAVGGPNLTPESDGFTAQLIALCPGNPTVVLKDDVEADHIAGVNMAFRRDVLLSIGGFDPQHTRAGDDVDVCWRLMDAGHRIGFCPTAIVWHHRRPSISRYLKQQAGYGEAENQLERKHPERFNLGGYIRWAGRVYGAPRSVSNLLRPFVYHGRLGEGMFQTLYQKEPSFLLDGPAMVHWYAVWAVLFGLTPVSIWFLPLAASMLAASLGVALFAGTTIQAPIDLDPRARRRKVLIVSLLHFVHPIVRTYGRLRARIRTSRLWSRPLGLRWVSPRRLLPELRFLLRRPKQTVGFWGIGSADREAMLEEIQHRLKTFQIGANLGREWDNHDLSSISSARCEGRIYSAPEHYDQALRFGFRARMPSVTRTLLAGAFLGCGLPAFFDPRWAALLVLPGALWILALAERARLRARVWEAIHEAADRRGAHPYVGTQR